MKDKGQKPRRDLQALLEDRGKLEGEIAFIETQIDDMETTYLEKTLLEGNVVIGWSRHPPPSGLPPKVAIDCRLKLFSLSSLSSAAFSELGAVPNRQLSPYSEPRFDQKYGCSKIEKE